MTSFVSAAAHTLPHALPMMPPTPVPTSLSRASGGLPNYGLSMRFKVTLDGARSSLGDWSSCSGLAVTFNHESYDEGGTYEYQRLLPGRMSYSDVVLERAITGRSWEVVQAWLVEVRDSWVHGDATTYQGGNATITLFGPATDGVDKVLPVVSWTLRDVLPVSWTGPSLAARSNEVATERLVLRHQGFLEAAGGA
jgi:phage tail-like protein